MKNPAKAAQARRELDDILKKWARMPKEPPKRGWLREIREAYGLTSTHLAPRLKMTQSGLLALEQSEAAGTIQLKTLRKVAKALRCELVYALVPAGGTLEKTLEKRRKFLAEMKLLPILKDASLSTAEKRELIAEVAKKISADKVWGELPRLV
jgi:predicted DNA-binding mobile mystery protein A